MEDKAPLEYIKRTRTWWLHITRTRRVIIAALMVGMGAVWTFPEFFASSPEPTNSVPVYEDSAEIDALLSQIESSDMSTGPDSTVVRPVSFPSATGSDGENLSLSAETTETAGQTPPTRDTTPETPRIRLTGTFFPAP